jgi:hypothetical protein
MRSYIFTKKERQIINAFYAGKVVIGDDIMRQVVHRLRTFKDLKRDVELYARLTEAVSATSA